MHRCARLYCTPKKDLFIDYQLSLNFLAIRKRFRMMILQVVLRVPEKRNEGHVG